MLGDIKFLLKYPAIQLETTYHAYYDFSSN